MMLNVFKTKSLECMVKKALLECFRVLGVGKVVLLLDGFVGDERGVVDLFSEGLEDLLPVLVEVAVDLIDGLVLDDPELTLGVTNKTFVVRHYDDAT